MSLKYLNAIIPFRRMLVLCAVFVIVVETIVVSFVTVTGYITVASVSEFVIRLIHSYILSYVACIFVAYTDLYIVDFFNKHLEWGRRNLLRVIFQLLTIVLIAVIFAMIVTFASEMINSYQEPLQQVLLNNILILCTANILITIVLELWIALFEKSKAVQKRDKLAVELSDLKYLILQSQIDPHFLFNSLNVLSGLLDKDTQKAKYFVDELAFVYRFVLETIDVKLVKLQDEIDFAKSYMELIKIRYDERIEFEIFDIDEEGEIPPMTLQLAVENAIKHNLATKDNPLRIYIFCENNCVIVKNNIQSKYSKSFSSGLGQLNAQKRYRLVSHSSPEFYAEDNEYISKFPIIRAIIDESSYH